MPQTFNVLNCYKCHIFQVQQEKKSNKWCCKVCNEKQSLKHVYGSGSGFDCRQHVQKLNMLRGEAEDSQRSIMEATDDHDASLAHEYESEDESFETEIPAKSQPSKWDKFLDDEGTEDLEVDYWKPAEKVSTSSCQVFKSDGEARGTSFKYTEKFAPTRARRDNDDVGDPFKIATDFDFDL